MGDKVLKDGLLLRLDMLTNFFEHNNELLDEFSSTPSIGDGHQSPEFTHRLEIYFHSFCLEANKMASDPFLD